MEDYKYGNMKMDRSRLDTLMMLITQNIYWYAIKINLDNYVYIKHPIKLG